MPSSSVRGSSPSIPRLVVVGVLAALAATLPAGCAPSGTVSDTIRPAATATGFATTTSEPKDFVQKSRSASEDYLPVGITPPARELKVMTKEELDKAQKDLESTRSAHDRLAHRPPPTAAKDKSKAKVKPAAPKKQGETGATSQ